MNKVQKKNEMIVEASHKFDLHTGNKLFSPRISAGMGLNNSKKCFTPKGNSGAGFKKNSFKKVESSRNDPS